MKVLCALATTFLLLGGCATVTPVTKDTQRNFKGFSVLPPQGSNWQVNSLRDDLVSFEKRATSSKHRLIVGVQRYPVNQHFGTRDEYLAYVQNTYFQANPKYYEFLDRQAELSSRYGDFCIRYHYRYKDTKMARPKEIPYVVHEGRCYVCLHPESRNYEFNICRSEEFAPGQEDPQLHTEEEQFIENFSFTKFVQ